MENLTQTETFFHHKDGIGVPVAKPVISGFVHLFGPTHLSKRTIEKALEDLPQHTFEKCGTLETSWTFETSGTFEIETSNTFETFGTFETSDTRRRLCCCCRLCSHHHRCCRRVTTNKNGFERRQ